MVAAAASLYSRDSSVCPSVRLSVSHAGAVTKRN